LSAIVVLSVSLIQSCEYVGGWLMTVTAADLA
jgi:hypothetical protein